MEKQNKFVKDMTKGNPMQLLIQFSLPLLVGNIFQQLYNMVDSIIVGNFVGANALGAIGTTNSLNFFFFSLVAGLSVGIGISSNKVVIPFSIESSIQVMLLVKAFLVLAMKKKLRMQSEIQFGLLQYVL